MLVVSTYGASNVSLDATDNIRTLQVPPGQLTTLLLDYTNKKLVKDLKSALIVTTIDLDELKTFRDEAKTILEQRKVDVQYVEKSENCWYFIMYWAKQHNKWDFLEKQCVAAHMFGTDNDSVYLQTKALEFGCFAYNGLGKTDKARKAAEVVLERLRATGGKEAALAEWMNFIATLEAA